MSKLLYVISSPRGGQSESRAIADEFLGAYRRSEPTVELDVLGLWTEPLPVYGGEGVAARMSVFAGQTPCGDQASAWAEVQQLFARFDAADEYLFYGADVEPRRAVGAEASDRHDQPARHGVWL